MSTLQLICGCSGSGKSTWLEKYAVNQSEKEPEKNFLILVPEQFTMATQKELVSLYPGHSIMNIDVLSFQRLAFRVFDDLGIMTLSVLGETGKNLVLRKAAQSCGEELPYLGGNMRRMGYVSELKSLISELMQYGISPEGLWEVIEKEQGDSAFSYKLKDVHTLYQAFRSYIEGSYITAEEILGLLIQVADRSELLSGSTLIFDGFTGFTPVQIAALERIFPLVSEIKVAVTVDGREDILRAPALSDLFYLSEKMIHSLLKLAKETGTEVLDPIILKDAKEKRFLKSNIINQIERRIFRNSKLLKDDVNNIDIEKPGDQLRLVSLSDPREELLFAASMIRRLVREEGERYRDFAIVTGDLGTYANYAREVFEKFQIPVFVDGNLSILYHPLTELLRGALQILSGNWRSEDVFYYLRTGLTSFTDEEIDELENYVLARGIRGKGWKRRFARIPTKGSEEDLERLNHLRETLVNSFTPLEEAFLKGERTAEIECEALYRFLTGLSIEERLLSESEELDLKGMPEKAREYEKIYPAVIDLLDQMHHLLSGEVLTPGEFQEILDAGFEAVDIGVLPPGYDRVTLGDIERTRLGEIKTLFFIGVRDGVIPGISAGGGIISELERETLKGLGMELSPSPKERAFIQRFYLYMNLTKPSKRLILTWPRVDSEGRACRSSYLIGTMHKLFPTVPMEEPKDRTYLLETPESTMELLLTGFEEAREGAAPEEWLAILAWYLKNPETHDFAERMLDAAFLNYQRIPLSRKSARALYGAILKGSVTRLEQYASCAFSHFLRYGLCLTEREYHEMRAPDLGKVYHGALERYGRKLEQENRTWIETKEEERSRLIRESLSEVILEGESDDFFADAKGRFDRKRMERILDRSLQAFTDQLRAGRFLPEELEIRFGGEHLSSAEFSLGPEERMFLTGQIDRLDTMDTGEDLYVKVVDYKSGSQRYDLLAVYEGVQLQLVTYLNVAEELMARRHPGKKVHPGGIFYCHLEDPLISGESDQKDEEIQSEIRMALRPDGVFNASEEAAAGLDEALSDPENSSGSEVLRARRKKNGEFDSYTNALTEEELSAIGTHVSEKIRSFGREILEGEIGIAPMKLKNNDACRYCGYRGVCGYDERIPGFRHREVPERTREEILYDIKSGNNIG